VKRVGVSVQASVCTLGDGDSSRPFRSERTNLFLGLSFVGDLSLASFLRSLISRRNLDMTLSLSSARDPTEGEKFSER
jgi:hypothetical protein